MRERLRALATFVTFAFQADAPRAVFVIALALLEAAVRASWPLWLKLITEGALERDLGNIVFAAAGYGGAYMLLGLTNLPRVEIEQTLVEKTSFLIDARLIELIAEIPTIEHHERPEHVDKIKVLERERQNLGAMVYALTGSLMIYATLGGTLLLLGTVHPLLLLLPAFALPAALAGTKAAFMRQNALDDTAETTRAAEHVMNLATSAASGMETRIFRLGEMLLGRHRTLWGRFTHEMSAVERKAALLSAGGWAIFAIAYAGALAFTALRVVADPASVSIGDLVMTISITGSLIERLGGAVLTVRWLGSNLKVVGRYLWLVDEAEAARARAGGSNPPPQALERGLELRDLTFRYPGTDIDVLRGLDLSIPAGATVALVGENGAGKTTLVKLMCGMYQPTEGSILVDGQDLGELSLLRWREQISAGFQDFVRFELAAREAVGVGELSSMSDAAAVLAALDRAHARGVVDELPSGLETQLGKLFSGGVQLSVGQWQKVALGRAMMRHEPLLLVLDEPTASLDADAEHALFEQYAGAARRVAARNGGITVLVSHRFSTVRMADVIVVLERGRIVESGTHDDLTARGGLYAELYTLQARAYR